MYTRTKLVLTGFERFNTLALEIEKQVLWPNAYQNMRTILGNA